jgi:hypothetical protein
MVFKDPYMLTPILVIVVVMIIGNLYFLAHFSHFGDSFFGSSAATKGLLVSWIKFVTSAGNWVYVGSRADCHDGP